MKSKILFLISAIFSVSGCVSALSDPQNHVVARDKALPKIDVSNVSHDEKIRMYADQLVSQTNTYATVRGYPFAPFNDDLINVDPIQVLKVDNTPIKVIPSNLNHGFYYFPAKMSETQLKIPVGTHSLLVSGTGFENKARYTLLPPINFEAGKHYIIKPLKGDKSFGSLQVYEYQLDSRFKANDRDSIILGKPVSAPVAIDNITPNF